MKLKTSEFQALFNDGLTGLAGETQLWPDTCRVSSLTSPAYLALYTHRSVKEVSGRCF